MTLTAGQEDYMKCPRCENESATSWYTCNACDYHYPIGNTQRIDVLFDQGSFHESYPSSVMTPERAEQYGSDYQERLETARQRTRLMTACLTGTGTIHGQALAYVGLDFAFLGGSADPVVTDRILQQIHDAQVRGIPLLYYISSTGTGVNFGLEGRRNLCRLLDAISTAGVPSVTVFSHIVSAGALYCFSAAAYLIAEPDTAIITMGKRIITEYEATQGRTLPEGFQSPRYAFSNGIIDTVVRRDALRDHLSGFLSAMHSQSNIPEMRLPDKARARIVSNPEAVPEYSVLDLYQQLTTSPQYDLQAVIIALLDDGIPLFPDWFDAHDLPVIRPYMGHIMGEPAMCIAIGQRFTGRDFTGCRFGSITCAELKRLIRMIILADSQGIPLVFLIDTDDMQPSTDSEQGDICQYLRQLHTTLRGVNTKTASVLLGTCQGPFGETLMRTDSVLMFERALNLWMPLENMSLKQHRDITEVAAAYRFTAHEMLEAGYVRHVCITDDVSPSALAQAIKAWLHEHIFVASQSLQI